MNIDEMPAGVELDALIAERVIGLTEFPHEWDSDGYGSCRNCSAECAYHSFRIDGPKNCPRPPDYSADIAAAWQVLEKLKERGFFAMVSTPTPGFKNWECRGWQPDPDRNRFIAHGKTAALAICRAALLALRVPA